MKVLHLNNYIGGSGTDLAFSATIAALRAHSGIENLVAAVDGGDLRLTSWEQRRGLGKLAYIYSNENRGRLAKFLAQHQPDILHAHGFYAAISPSILSAIARARDEWGMKFIQTAHSHELVCSNSSAYDDTEQRICTDCRGKHPKLKIFYRNCDRRGWVHSWIKGVRCFVAHDLLKQVEVTDHIICPSEMMRESLAIEGLDRAKLSVLHNPVDTGRLDPGSARAREIVYFGRFAPEKDLDTLCEGFLAFQRNHERWRLVLIGEGPEHDHLEARFGSSPYIEILPFMTHDMLFARLAQARIMVMSSRLLENAPLVIPESVMCGLWPVVPDHGGMAEMVKYVGAGSCYRYGEPASLIDALRAAAADEDDLRDRLRSAQDFIEAQMRPRPYAKQVQAIYESVASRLN
ncbi:MAG TPA: glycosyltransferase family 4 protein [Pseudomonadales bacterium]|nr:glycosyltransferase family 4 protein [Pseudomonadales bacterium]